MDPESANIPAQKIITIRRPLTCEEGLNNNIPAHTVRDKTDQYAFIRNPNYFQACLLQTLEETESPHFRLVIRSEGKKLTMSAHPPAFYDVAMYAIGDQLVSELHEWASLCVDNTMMFMPAKRHWDSMFEDLNIKEGSGFHSKEAEILYSQWVYEGYMTMRKVLTKLRQEKTLVQDDSDFAGCLRWPESFGFKAENVDVVWVAPAFIQPERIGYSRNHWFPAQEPYLDEFEVVEPEDVPIEMTHVHEVITSHFPEAAEGLEGCYTDDESDSESDSDSDSNSSDDDQPEPDIETEDQELAHRRSQGQLEQEPDGGVRQDT
ncbi:hypothetical protein BJ508DRAFT_314583 [Ascobolus immersus RN42]|uniref:Uncharacterized protein n=1 Tax=Ascobolus immersus RN42 TaxID=1160509 RepID=A0A3N4HL72_ASCIM|nr:hypothetical protein BJ508DRAFT_314583 [Ascobolus immersus RN42]